jgi:cation-transporting ATPase F
MPHHGPSHHLAASEVSHLLGVNVATGLDEAEAGRRLRLHGPNRIDPPPEAPVWRRFLRVLAEPLSGLLLAAATVTAFLSQWADAGVIAAVVLVNALLGTWQEGRAGRAIGALARLVTTHATVRRGRRTRGVEAGELVPGDVVLLAPGDRVPADLRLAEVHGLHVDESALTGESLPVPKHSSPVALETLLADRRNVAFTGSLVTAGEATGVVWATGRHTETGHLAHLLGHVPDRATPLTRKLERFSRRLLAVVLLLAAATFALGLARGTSRVDSFMAAVALAVGAVPEGLPAAVTITLALGAGRMARRRAIVRRLPAVEALGATTVICSDKTGTLTENRMTAQEVRAGGEAFAFSGTGYAPAGEVRSLDGTALAAAAHPALAECLLAGTLCNDARLVERNGSWEAEGDPTEAALLAAAGKAGLVTAVEQASAPRLDTIPFAAAGMFRATLHHTRRGRMIYKVGAGEHLLERCHDQLDATGHPVPFDRAAAQHAIGDMAARGLRVLTVARRDGIEGDRLHPHHVAAGLTFLGLVGMIDPPRPEAADAVRRCRAAGIAVKMITGDHPATAAAIAVRLGLHAAPIPTLTGRELAALPDDALPAAAGRTVVFARVAPEQKLRLVQALQAGGQIVAMTGDGVNDAPALKAADIGVAMGRGGTDVAKGAADMVLADDNFASIEAAVEEGRGVFDTLLKFLVWIVPTNAGEALILLTALVLGWQLPVLPVQLLWINLATEGLLGMALVFEPPEHDLMERPPRDPRRPLLTRALLLRLELVSLIMLAGAYWLFAWELGPEGQTLAAARTAVVNVIVAVQAAYLLNCRSLQRPFLARSVPANPWVPAGIGLALALQLAFTYAPFMNRWFHSAPLPAASWLRIAAVAGAAFGLIEAEKWLRFRGARGLPPE